MRRIATNPERKKTPSGEGVFTYSPSRRHYSNPDVKKRMEKISRLASWVSPVESADEARSSEHHGSTTRAVLDILVDARRPMRVKEILVACRAKG